MYVCMYVCVCICIYVYTWENVDIYIYRGEAEVLKGIRAARHGFAVRS